MLPRFFLRLTLFGLPLLILMSVGISSAASISMSPIGIDLDNPPLDPNELKPPVCTQTLNNTIIRDGNGSSGNDLILGSSNDDLIYGQGGDDCILGGDGSDEIYGDGTGFWNGFGNGSDVIFGGDGNDTLVGDGWIGGSGDDEIYGEGGNDEIYGDGFFLGDGTDTCDGGSGTNNLFFCNP